MLYLDIYRYRINGDYFGSQKVRGEKVQWREDRSVAVAAKRLRQFVQNPTHPCAQCKCNPSILQLQKYIHFLIK